MGKRVHGLWEAGTTGFIPAGEQIQISAHADVQQYFLLIEDELIREICTDHIRYSSLNFHPADITSDPAAIIARSAVDLAKAGGSDDWPLLCESMSVALAVAVVRAVSPEANMIGTAPQSGLSLSRKKRVLGFIQDHMTENITLDAMASVAAMSKFHFARSFKCTFGITPMQAVMRTRAAAAKKAIRHGRLQLSDIAAMCGYRSQSHMTDHFKIIYGVTPGAYRLSIK